MAARDRRPRRDDRCCSTLCPAARLGGHRRAGDRRPARRTVDRFDPAASGAPWAYGVRGPVPPRRGSGRRTRSSSPSAFVPTDTNARSRGCGTPGMTFPVGKPRFFAGAGAVSPGGLIAIPATRDGWLVQWEIFDLHHPETAPIVVPGIEQDTDQIPIVAVPSGPERARAPSGDPASASRSRGTSGWTTAAATTWASTTAAPPRSRTKSFPMGWGSVLTGRPTDRACSSTMARCSVPGGFVGGSALDAVPNCRTVDRTGVDISSVGSSDFEFACLAPDDSAIAERAATGAGHLARTGRRRVARCRWLVRGLDRRGRAPV